MKILLDTNFILTCVKQKIDFFNLSEELFDYKIEWIIPQQVLNELNKMKNKKDKTLAEIGLNIINLENVDIVDIGKNKNVDIAIVDYITNKDIILATLDKGLKKRIKNKILTIRNKKMLEIIQ